MEAQNPRIDRSIPSVSVGLSKGRSAARQRIVIASVSAERIDEDNGMVGCGVVRAAL